MEFNDSECEDKYGINGLNRREDCYRIIERARDAGYDIDYDIEERLY